jgi:Fe-S oxidoreductase
VPFQPVRGPLPIGRPAGGIVSPLGDGRGAGPSPGKRGRLGGSKRVAGLAIPMWLPLGGLALVTAVETGRIDGPHREIFFNIGNFWVLYALLPLVIVIIGYGIMRRSRVWRLGRADFSFDNPWVRLRRLLRGGIGTERVLRDPYSGVMHLCIMSSMVVLFLVTALLAVDDYLPDDQVRILVGDRYLGYSLVADVFGLIGLVGVGMAVAHRWLRPRTAWLPSYEDKLIVGGLGLLLITGFLVEGLRIQTSEIGAHPEWSHWSPVGFVVAEIFSQVNTATLLDAHKALWWFHMVAALSWISLLGFTKLNHLLLAPVNALLASTGSSGRLTLIRNIEEQEHFGVSQLEHFTQKQLFELDVCVSCGRCTDSCPADIAGQPLSPMHIIQDLNAYATDVGARKASNLARGLAIDAGLEHAPVMVGEVIRDESLWACRTCGACVQECPVFIEHIPTIVDMRRSLVMEEARMPEPVRATLETLERQGHPWRGTPHTRESWMEDLDVPLWTGEQEYLYFVGCTGALVDRVQPVTKAVVRLLREAGVSFGVLAGQESCNGDPARRMGNEYLFQVMAAGLIATLNEGGVKKIVTHCPHCFNTFKNEYPDLGGHYEVIHHSVLLERLVNEGKLAPKSGAEPTTVTFHDSCYLGRHNNLYEAPRNILQRIPNLTLVEMPRNREQGLCCGAGGGNMWMEEQGRQRVNEVRVAEAIGTGADSACTVCPFCIQMFESGVGTVQMAEDESERLGVFDIVEFLEVAVGVSTTPAAGEAADQGAGGEGAAGGSADDGDAE